MFKRFKINKFNQKWAGRELLFCPRIYEDILFWPLSVHKCCHCTKVPYSPPFIARMPDKLNLEIYLEHLDRIMTSNQKPNGVCQGCKFLIKQTVPKFEYEKQIKFFTINHFTKCNSNCIYCAIGMKTEDIKFQLLPVIKQMMKEKMFNEGCLINWGGGEPLLCSEFEDIAEFFLKNHIRQAINSSGIEFSNTILEGLKDGSMSIQISPDAGTEETYIKIKRQNNFNRVWGNIKKYAQYPDMLFVKYIFFSVSANENDVRQFIEKCKEAGVKHIVIDCESNSANNPNSPFGNINEDIINLASLMKKLAIENNLAYEISYQWRDEHKQIIENA